MCAVAAIPRQEWVRAEARRGRVGRGIGCFMCTVTVIAVTVIRAGAVAAGGGGDVAGDGGQSGWVIGALSP